MGEPHELSDQEVRRIQSQANAWEALRVIRANIERMQEALRLYHALFGCHCEGKCALDEQ